jgi:type I restriction enzyme R subunit
MTFNEDSRVKIPSLLHLTHTFDILYFIEKCYGMKTPIFSPLFFISISKPRNWAVWCKTIIGWSFFTIKWRLGKAFMKECIRTIWNSINWLWKLRNNTSMCNWIWLAKDDEDFAPDITLLMECFCIYWSKTEQPRWDFSGTQTYSNRFENKKFRKFVNTPSWWYFPTIWSMIIIHQCPLKGLLCYGIPSENHHLTILEEDTFDLSTVYYLNLMTL